MKRSSIISLGLLIAAAIGLTVLFIMLKNKENKPTDPEKENFFTVKAIDVGSVDRISLKSTLYNAVFTKQEDTWYNDADLLNQSAVTQIPESLLANLRAIAKVDNPAPDEEYGLDAPAAVLEAYAGDTRLVRIELGNKVPTKNCYYARFDGEKTVYTVAENYGRILLREKSYFVKAVTMPSIPGIKNIDEIILEGDLFPAFHAVKDKNNPYDYSGSGVLPWYFTTPYRAQWEADIIGGNWMNQLEYYLSIHPEDMRTAKPDEFAEYGLDNPGATLTVRYSNDSGTEQNSYTIYIGNQIEETGSYYARLKGMDALLVLSYAKVHMLCDVDVFQNTYHAVFYPSIRTFSKVTVRAGSALQVFTHEVKDGADIYLLNGREITNADALSWAQAVVSLKTTSFRPTETPESEPILTITVEVEDKTRFKDMTIRIFRGEEGKDIVERLGVCDCTIDSRAVDDFIKMLGG